jgi:ACS family tartrate transporter-like MFS transporter
MAQLVPPRGERALSRRVAWRLIPFTGLLYLLAFLDRVNVGFAALTMNADLKFSPMAFGTGAGIFFIGYVLLGVPSNLMLHRYGARRWISGTMIAWGVISGAMVFIRSPSDFYALRFLLGVAEAGFFPGIILYLTFWFAENDRARILGAFMVALPLSTAVGAPVSSFLLGLHSFGIHGWQWLFLLEGIPAVVVGTLVLKVLADSPAQAKWLTPSERAQLTERTQEHQSGTNPESIGLALRQPSLWVFSAAYFALLLSLYSYSIWLPQIVQGLARFTYREIGLLAMLPNLAAVLFMYPWSRNSDATRERHWHVALPLLLAALGLALSAFVHAPAASMAGLTLGAVGIYCSLPIFWSLPAERLTGAAAAAGIALVNSVGNLGGCVGLIAVGYLRQVTDGYSGGLLLLAGSVTLAALLVLSARQAVRIRVGSPRPRSSSF